MASFRRSLGEVAGGDVSLYLEGGDHFYALKTVKTARADRSEMVPLGPTFLQGSEESYLLAWQPATVLLLGKSCSILLPSDPTSWSTNGPSRTSICLAVTGDKTYICTNGGADSHGRYFPCFVDTSSGEIVEGRLRSSAAYTNTWEIAVLGTSHTPRTILKSPLKAAGR